MIVWLISRPSRLTSRAGWDLRPVCSGMEIFPPPRFHPRSINPFLSRIETGRLQCSVTD